MPLAQVSNLTDLVANATAIEAGSEWQVIVMVWLGDVDLNIGQAQTLLLPSVQYDRLFKVIAPVPSLHFEGCAFGAFAALIDA